MLRPMRYNCSSHPWNYTGVIFAGWMAAGPHTAQAAGSERFVEMAVRTTDMDGLGRSDGLR